MEKERIAEAEKWEDEGIYDRALAIYEQEAEKGDAEAINRVGLMLYTGRGRRRDLSYAFSCFQRAADLDFTPAMTNLAGMFEKGEGVFPDTAIALEWYDRAAERGDAMAAGKAKKLRKEIKEKERQELGLEEPPGRKTVSLLAAEQPDGERLEKLIGLREVKEELQTVISLAKLERMRSRRGLPRIPTSRHLIFSGNPGTGKTTVARLLAEEYKKCGILRKGHLVEVTRVDLVSQYIGETAIKTDEKIQEARGGILFIDEAYSLFTEAEDRRDFGREAVEILLKRMEDYRDDLVVVAAGYPELMESFLSSNPGLRSRFGRVIRFPDYSDEEMLQIFRLLCSQYELKPDDELLEIVRVRLKTLKKQRGSRFANAREARQIFETVIAAQARRIALMPKVSEEALSSLIEEDGEELKEKAGSGLADRVRELHEVSHGQK